MDNQAETSMAEAVAGLLRQQRANPTSDGTDLLAKAVAHIHNNDISEVELTICAVALTEVLQQQGRVCWLPQPWVHEIQLRAQDWLLLVARGSADQSSVGVEEWILSIGAPLATVSVPARPDLASTIAQLISRLASLSSDTPVAIGLLSNIGSMPWSIDAKADVVATIVELATDTRNVVAAADMDAATQLANSYLDSNDELSPETAGRLERALTTTTHTDEHGTRLTTTFGALISSGDYHGASMVARQIRDSSSPRLALIGANLELMSQLHTAELDDAATARVEITRLHTLASLPESVALEATSPLASPHAMLREIIAHQIGVGHADNHHNAAVAIRALVESRSALLRTPPSTAPVIDQLAAMASHARNTEPSEHIASWTRSGEPTIHIGDLAITPDMAVTATTVTHHDQTNAMLTPFYGNDLRVITKLVKSPSHAERLTDREIERLRRLFHIPIGHTGVICPTARLWAIPWERLAPQSRVATGSPTTPKSDRVPQRDLPLFIAVIDDQLPGAQAERSTLIDLRDQGLIELQLPDSLKVFVHALTTNQPDVAVLALHGHGAGLTYAFQLGHEKLPTHQLAELPLPPIVSAASCHSGTIGAGADLGAVLERNTQAAVVSLWDILDRDTSSLLGDFYKRLAVGETAAEAWSDTAAHAATIGLRLIHNQPAAYS